MRCIGVAGEDRVATAAGMGIVDTLIHLRSLSERSLVVLDAGPFGGWNLTESGRIADQELVRKELDIVGARDHVRSSYESFLGLNPALLQTSGEWQMRKLGDAHAINDHSDPDYDAEVLSRLIRIDASAQRICSDLASRLVRFGVYGYRLTTALDRALGGDTAYVTDSLDSYHTVWFQLHEDLLVTLGISRQEERGGFSGSP
jgi:hypothetical protein